MVVSNFFFIKNNPFLPMLLDKCFSLLLGQSIKNLLSFNVFLFGENHVIKGLTQRMSLSHTRSHTLKS